MTSLPGERAARRRACAWAAWLFMGVGACGSTGVGNPAPALTLSLAIVNDDAPDLDALGAAGDLAAAGTSDGTSGAAGSSDGVAGATASDGGAAAAEGGTPSLDPSEAQPLPQGAIQDAVLVFGKLHFMPCDRTRGSIFTVPGPFVVDLKHHTTTPEIPDIQATPGGYCGIDAPLAPALDSAALAGRSVFFDGYRSDGTFFIVYANMAATLRLRAKAGATWEGSAQPPRFFWALRPRRWLVPAELDALVPTPYDDHLRAIVIDGDRHADLYAAIRARLAGVSRLYADVNDDGVFDDADREAEVGVGLDNAD